MLTDRPHLDEATKRRLAVQIDCDPRTILRAYRGRATKSASGRRAEEAVRLWLAERAAEQARIEAEAAAAAKRAKRAGAE